MEVGVKECSKKTLGRRTWASHVEKMGDEKLAKKRCPESGGEMETNMDFLPPASFSRARLTRPIVAKTLTIETISRLIF